MIFFRMRQRPDPLSPMTIGALLFMVVALIFLPPLAPRLDILNASEWAGWAQAAGTFVAIIATGSFGRAQFAEAIRQRRVEQHEEKIGNADVLIALTQRAWQEGRDANQYLDSYPNIDALDVLSHWIETIPLNKLPDDTWAMHAISAGMAINKVVRSYRTVAILKIKKAEIQVLNYAEERQLEYAKTNLVDWSQALYHHAITLERLRDTILPERKSEYRTEPRTVGVPQ